MLGPTKNLRAYLQAVSGGPVSPIRRLTLVEKKLSLALRGRYRLESVHLFDHELVLAVESTGLGSATPAAYAAHLAALAPSVQAPVVLVLPGITSTTRARLVAARVPFIVPGNQLFLPMLLVDLRERMKRPVIPREATLGSVAQLVVLAHLQGHRMDVQSLADAANRLGYSPMMLTKAKDELVAAGLCTVRPEGRSLRLAFVAEGRTLWEKALPRLSTPVARTQLVRFPTSLGAAMGFARAGVSALSNLTSLADDALVTYASSKAVAAAAGSKLQRVDLEEDAHARLEVWRYAPELLSTDGCVDALSLYLSLRDTPHERVQGALSDLLEYVRW
jgi:DNA-binding MarR family transcriptional regulator